MKTLYITNRIHVRYLSGFSGSECALLVTPKKTYFCTDSRYILRAQRELKRGIRTVDITEKPEEKMRALCKKLRIRTLGIEANHVTLRNFQKLKKIFRGVKLVPKTDLIENMRLCKKKHEIKNMKKAQRITDQIFYSLKRILRKGMREIDIAWQIRELAHKFGANSLSFSPIVAINKNAAIPHHKSGATRLKEGDVVLLDFGVRVNGYNSDMSRTIFIGKPAPKQIHAYTQLLKVQKRMIEKLKPGVYAKNLDCDAKKYIEKAGLPPYRHGLGHGVGLEIHEAPNLSQKSKERLKKGMIVTVEPGIYLENRFGIRIEDMVLVKGRKPRVLTKSPKELRDMIIRFS